MGREGEKERRDKDRHAERERSEGMDRGGRKVQFLGGPMLWEVFWRPRGRELEPSC